MAEKTKVAVSDIDGVLRGKFIHPDKLTSALKGGFGFCSVVLGWDCADACYPESKFYSLSNGYPDILTKIDAATQRNLPSEPNTQFFLADFYAEDGKPLSICPRQVLKAQVNKAATMGYSALFGLEFEWFNFQETSKSLNEKNFQQLTPLSPGMFGYSILRAGQSSPFFHDLIDSLEKFRVPLEGVHTETGPGVLEAALVASDALEAADRAVLFKWMAKEIASRHNLTATFMAKWNSKMPGCSGHMHQSLWSKDNPRNLFFDERTPNNNSALFESYLAGQVKLMPELLPFYAPNINSYKRLVEGFWAPTSATFGTDNRTAALRIIPGSEKSHRLETRVSGADINPYLSVAAALGSGLWGIENKLKLVQKESPGNAYLDKEAPPLPRTLALACDALEKSVAARQIFGDDFVDHFVLTRRWECRQYRQTVTDFELRRYFEVI